MYYQSRIEGTQHYIAWLSAGFFERRMPRTWILIAILTLTLFGFGIRLHALSSDSFWADELITINVSNGGIESILDVRDHPPLLYFLTRASIYTFGETEFTVRLPSALIGLLAIPLLISFGKVLDRPLAGILAALLIILSPFHIRHAQEARHYALFLTFSLATYLILFLAMKKPSFSRWISYGLATTLNLYIHYGAFIVLAVQSLMILGWSMKVIANRRYLRLLFPLSATIIVILLYTFQIPRLGGVINRTFIDKGNVGFNSQDNLLTWIGNLYPALGTSNQLLAPVLFALCLVGIFILFHRREWFNFTFCFVGLGLPLTLVIITGADRSSNPRYVIYLLPFFLILVAIAIDDFLRWLYFRVGSGTSLASLVTIIFLILIISLPMVQDEYDYAIQDWRNVAQILDDVGQDGDIVLAMTLSLPDLANVVSYSLPYYLDKNGKQFYMIEATRFSTSEIEDIPKLQNQEGNVWGVVMYWGLTKLEDQGFQAKPFQGFTYLIQDPEFKGTSQERILNLYDKLVPLSHAPLPQCLLKQDMAFIYHTMDRFNSASSMQAASQEQCPEMPNPGLVWRQGVISELLTEQFQRAFNEAQSAGNFQEARHLAETILLLFPKNEEYLAYLTFADLLDMFDQNQALVESSASEPVSRTSFGMPPNNYEGDVLLLHPPGRVTYDLTLPEDPLVFRTRISMVPDSWEWGGDGSTFVVQVETEDDQVTELLRQHISNEMGDRRWHPVEIPLEEYAGQRVRFSLQTEIGSAGNNTGDWAIWDRPAIWWETEKPLVW